jgi:hypothetical protein
MTQSLPIEDQQNQGVAASPPLSHPSGAEPVPVSGKAGIANAGDALLPCPFTGRVATGPIQQGDGYWRIYGGSYFLERPSRDLVIAAWNTRKSAAPLLLEALDWYADQLCEGWCEKSACCAHFEDCAGCLARRTAASARGGQ